MGIQNNANNTTTVKAQQQPQQLNVTVKGNVNKGNVKNEEALSTSSIKEEDLKKLFSNEKEVVNNDSNVNLSVNSVDATVSEVTGSGHVSAKNGADFATGKNNDLSLSTMPTKPERTEIAMSMIRVMAGDWIKEHDPKGLAVSIKGNAA